MKLVRYLLEAGFFALLVWAFWRIKLWWENRQES
jgi:hypothetical protein